MYTRIIRIEDAEPGMTLADAVYIVTTTGTNLLAARAGTVMDANLIKMLTTRKVMSVEIQSDTPPEDMSEPPVAPAPKPSVNIIYEESKPKPPPEQYVPIKEIVDNKLKEEAIDSVKQLFTEFQNPDGTVNKTTAFRCVDNLEGAVTNLLDVITGDGSDLVHINDLKEFDEYTYHHSLSVSMLAMTTGREMGLDGDTLFRLGRCAMMHDIGKQMIPLDIINKKGKLTNEEFATIKNHAVLGANSLKKAGIGDVELWNGIMFHHEKLNGSGYPNGLKGGNVPLFSRIIAVADVYDAVTSYRSYRLPMLPSEAFDIITKDVKNGMFDLGIVKAFFAKLELYPINTIVELSDTRLGMVVESEGSSRLRPTIRIWGSTEIVNLAASKNLEINIVGVMNPADLPEGYEFA
ncbi:MAG: HD-GYP domain-containing protein [Defluviitaleaceae bacterium]|nr:HD-GYP domain-containing protein [Defluviitaleaceae bacterium]